MGVLRVKGKMKGGAIFFSGRAVETTEKEVYKIHLFTD
jgi:hypothetical protein